MSTFQKISIEWNDLLDNLFKYIKLNNNFEINYFIKLIKQYKDLINDAKNELNNDHTILNKDIEWENNGFGYNIIYIVSIIEFGISRGIDMTNIIKLFNINNSIQKINDDYTIHDYIIDLYDFYQIDELNDNEFIIPDVD
jgi:hypothetical protein